MTDKPLSTEQRRWLRENVDALVASAKATDDASYRSLVQARLHLKGWARTVDIAWSALGEASYEANDPDLKARIVSLRNALPNMIF